MYVRTGPMMDRRTEPVERRRVDLAALPAVGKGKPAFSSSAKARSIAKDFLSCETLESNAFSHRAMINTGVAASARSASATATAMGADLSQSVATLTATS